MKQSAKALALPIHAELRFRLFTGNLQARASIAAKLMNMSDEMTNSTPGESMTIGRLATAAGVGVETIRYYQRRGLLPVPRSRGAVRHYSPALIDRIGFIKRAQGLGFTLDEVCTLLDLADGRNRRAIQAVTAARLVQIRAKLQDLQRMRRVLDDLLDECSRTRDPLPCPIIAVLMQRGPRAQVSSGH